MAQLMYQRTRHLYQGGVMDQSIPGNLSDAWTPVRRLLSLTASRGCSTRGMVRSNPRVLTQDLQPLTGADSKKPIVRRFPPPPPVHADVLRNPRVSWSWGGVT